MKKIFIFMAIGLVGCVGADEMPKRQYGGNGGNGGSLPGLPGGHGGHGGYGGGYSNYPSRSRQREYENNLYWYCLGLVNGLTKRKWRDYISYNDNMQNYYHPLHCQRFSPSPRQLLNSAKNYGRDGASYYGGIGGQGGRAGNGPGGGRGGNGGAGIAGGRGGHGGKGGSAY